MQIVDSCCSRALLRPLAPVISPIFASRRRNLPCSGATHFRATRPVIFVVVSSVSFDGPGFNGRSQPRSFKKSVLSDLIQEIEPLDLNLIQKDVPTVTVEAMKRTISGMLGILPSDRFNVFVEALWESLFKLLVSSMMTGYTLRNAEYRLSLERNLGINEDQQVKYEQPRDDVCEKIDRKHHDKMLDRTPTLFEDSKDVLFSSLGSNEETPLIEDINFEDIGELATPEAKEFIHNLKSRLSSALKDLHEAKRKNSGLQMQQFVGEEKNDLLNYLRSLQPEKVLELSEPTCSEVQEIIYSVAHGLLATLSPKINSRPPPRNTPPGGGLSLSKDDCAELVENTLHPLISVPRDYLARLLFWCLLLGHYLRGLEHRLELTQLLTVAGVSENVFYEDDI